jgi:hypothetical protein
MADGTFSGGLDSLGKLVTARKAAGNAIQPGEFAGLQDAAIRDLLNPQRQAGGGLVFGAPAAAPIEAVAPVVPVAPTPVIPAPVITPAAPAPGSPEWIAGLTVGSPEWYAWMFPQPGGINYSGGA